MNPFIYLPTDHEIIPIFFLGACAVDLASRRLLSRWIAQSALPVPSPHETEIKAASNPIPSSSETIEAQQAPRRITSSWTDFGKYTAAIAVLVGFVVHVQHQSHDIIVSSCALLCLMSTASSMLILLMALLPVPRGVRYEKSVGGKQWQGIVQRIDTVPRWRMPTATLITAVLFVLHDHGFTLLSGLFVTAGVYPLIGNCLYARMPAKRATIILTGYPLIAMLPYVLNLLFNLISGSTGTGGASPAASTSTIAEGSLLARICNNWTKLQVLFNLFQGPFYVTGVLLALALRFDYTRSGPKVIFSGTDEPQPGSVLVNIIKDDSAVDFPRPLYQAGMRALAVSVTIFYLLQLYFPWPEFQPIVAPVLAVFTLSPVVAITVAVTAWRHGVLAEWWAYTEVWMPDVEVVAGDEEATIEATNGDSDIKNCLFDDAVGDKLMIPLDEKAQVDASL